MYTIVKAKFSPQFFGLLCLTAKGAEPLQKLCEVHIPTTILVKHICKKTHFVKQNKKYFLSIFSKTCNSLDKGVILELWKRKKLLKAQLARAVRVQLAKPDVQLLMVVTSDSSFSDLTDVTLVSEDTIEDLTDEE